MATTASALVIQVGTTKIHYFPEKKIGKGTTSIVYQGYHGNAAIKTAVKQIEKDKLEVYKREVKVFTEILANPFQTSKNVVGLYDWAETDDYFYFSMEKANCNLREFLIQAPTQEMQVQIIQDTAHGLQFLHGKNILHRDIKPENVLIFHDGLNILAKLGDFGVSRQMSNDASTNSKGRGTENWMAPEAIRAKHNDEQFETTKSVDIFSLGMTAYFTLSNGVHPFSQSSTHGRNETMNIIDPNIKPTKLVQAMKSYAADHLLAWMMQKTLENRPNIKQVVSHPMFWKPSNCLDFTCHIARTLNDKHDSDCKMIRGSVDTMYVKLHRKLYGKNLDWLPLVDARLFIQTDGKKKNYRKDSMMSLVELIRDKNEHFKDRLPDLIGDLFEDEMGGYSEDKYINYYLALFPDMVVFLFCAFMDQIAPCFASLIGKYYKDYDATVSVATLLDLISN